MLAFLFCFSILVGALQSNHASQFPPAVDVVAPNYQYKQPINSLRRVDFRNLNLVIFKYLSGKYDQRVRVRNGEYHEREETGGRDVSIKAVQFFSTKHRESNYVVLVLNEFDWGGSLSATGIVQVLKEANHHAYVVQQLMFDLQAPGTGSTFNAKSGSLIIKARSKDNSAHCCAQHIDVVHFDWDGQRFEQQSVQTLDVPPRRTS